MAKIRESQTVAITDRLKQAMFDLYYALDQIDKKDFDAGKEKVVEAEKKILWAHNQLISIEKGEGWNA